MIRFDAAPLLARSRRPAASRDPGPPAPPPAAAEPDPETPHGCGWYLSSYDLEQGLEWSEVEWIDADLPPHLAVALRFV